MAEIEGEQPSSKRQRRDEKIPKVRTLKLELSKYPHWVGTLDHSELIKIFEIGVSVKESISMQITGGEKHFEKVVQKIKETETSLLGSQQSIRQDLSGIKETQSYLETKITEELMQRKHVPALKGAVGERKVISILRQALSNNHAFEDVSKQGGRGDIHVTSNVSGEQYLVEVKNHKAPVAAKEIQKFEENLRENDNFRVGIMLSLYSGIAQRAIQGKFEVTYENEQYYVYVPNAREEENLIVWSVLLADELTALDYGLTETQTQELLKLQQKFQKNVDKSKKCRSKLNSLKKIVDDLEEDLVPLLKIIDGAKNDLNKALHQRGKRSPKKKGFSNQAQMSIEDSLSRCVAEGGVVSSGDEEE